VIYRDNLRELHSKELPHILRPFADTLYISFFIIDPVQVLFKQVASIKSEAVESPTLGRYVVLKKLSK
jgi:hypothetical protein